MNRERRLRGRAVRKRRRIAARLDLIAARFGVSLIPWQREVAVSILCGNPTYVSRGRAAGWRTTQRVAQEFERQSL